MIIERTKNASRNIVFGVLLKVYQIIVPFIMRTAMIYCMGIQYVGLNSLFTSILRVLNLAELGVGSAMVYSMYKPIAEDDTRSICALMRLYKIYYRAIGLVIAVIGCALTPFIPNLIKSDLPPELNIYALYLLNLGATVLSYWLFAYKNCLFQAHQRVDVVSKITIISNTIQYGFQLTVLFAIKDYYLYVISALICQALNNILTAVLAKKYYPSYEANGRLDRKTGTEINRRIKDLFTSKLGAVVIGSADTVVISSFLGLTVLAVYQNYYFILSSIIGIISIAFNACTAGIGNSVITETKEKNYKDLNTFTFLLFWISCICCCCFACLYQPFMNIWVGNELMLNYSAVICLCIYFFVFEISQLLITYKDAAGIWHKDRFRSLITASTNLVLNIILVQIWGIYGVLLATVLATLVIGIPWLLNNLFSQLFERKYLRSYASKLIKYSGITFLCVVVCISLGNLIKGTDWIVLIIRAVICFMVSNTVIYIVLRNTEEFINATCLIKRILKERLHIKLT